MSDDDETREMFGVTPPQMDTPAVRDWLRSEAVAAGWTDLAWVRATDSNGRPYRRLFGTRPTRTP